MKKILTIIFALLGLCTIGASVTSTEIGNLHDYHNVVTNVDLTGLATSKDLETVKTNAIVKNKDNVVGIGFSIKQPSEYGGEVISLSFGKNDPGGPSIVMNRLYSTARASYFENDIVFIPTPNNDESLLSRIVEYSSAAKNASNEVVSIVSSAVDPVKNTVNEIKSIAEGAEATANAAAEQSSSALSATGEIQRRIDVEVNPSIETAQTTADTAISMISETNPTFSTAVLAVGLNIDTNSVAALNDIAETFGGFPIEGTATTVGGLLAALAAATAWLKKNKADKSELVAMKKELEIKKDENGLYYYNVEVK